MLTIIAAVAKNGVIGYNNKTPWNIPEELALFKTITMGHVLIVGRKTYESIGHELVGRRLFVLSRSPHPNPLPVRGEGNSVFFCSSLEYALEKTKHERSVFVIGGGDVYAQMMPIADEMRISHIQKVYTGDITLPFISPDVWQIKEQINYKLFTHIHYTRNATPSKNR